LWDVLLICTAPGTVSTVAAAFAARSRVRPDWFVRLTPEPPVLHAATFEVIVPPEVSETAVMRTGKSFGFATFSFRSPLPPG
jgi:hypothetical protein